MLKRIRNKELNNRRLETPEEFKEWQRKYDDSHFNFIAQNHHAWHISSMKTFRSAERIAYSSMEAQNSSFKRHHDSSGNYSYTPSIDEQLEDIDMMTISVAYFLLSRSIELILKAILIKKYPKSFLNEEGNKISFGKNGHDLIDLIKKAELELDETQINYLTLLNFYPFIGTYPTHLKVENNTTQREEEEKIRPLILSISNYEEVSFIYDILLDHYFETKHKNILRLNKTRKY
jgi:hypothetical protein